MQTHPKLSPIQHFQHLPEPRVARTPEHPLLDILVIAVCTLLCGGEGFNDMEDFGEVKHDWLKTFLKLRCGIPSHDTFKRVFHALDPASFLECFVRWTQSLRAVEFAQIKNMTLDDALVVEPSVFHDTPIKMVLAILATFGTTQKHDGVGS